MRYSRMKEWIERNQKDHRSGRDMRNFYDRRGYMKSDKTRGRGYDYARMADMAYDRESAGRDYYRDYNRSNYSMDGRDYEYDRESGPDYARRVGYFDYNDDYRRDYGEMMYLPDEVLMEWSKDLLGEIEDKDKSFFTKDTIKQKINELGIMLDKFTFGEFFTTVLMLFTDFKKSLGSTNKDVYLHLAKDWLCDEDAAVKYGEKLAAYYYAIVEGM